MSLRISLALSLLLTACAGYSGSGLVADESALDTVIQAMGQPRMEWAEPDGTQRLAYPRGPMGVHTYMVLIGADGKLQRIEDVLNPQSFGRVRPGMDKDQVLRTLGPPEPTWTAYFKARDELVWEWRYCDEWNKLARFDVLFDGAREVVRSTMTHPEDCGPDGDCACSR